MPSEPSHLDDCGHPSPLLFSLKPLRVGERPGHVSRAVRFRNLLLLVGFVLVTTTRSLMVGATLRVSSKEAASHLPLYLVALAIAVGAFILLPSQSHQSLSSAGSSSMHWTTGLLAPRYVPDLYVLVRGRHIALLLDLSAHDALRSNNKIRLLLISEQYSHYFLR